MSEHKSEWNELNYYARFKLAFKFDLALQYRDGSFAVKQDLEEMLHLLKSLAEEGYPPALSTLGECYYDGTGVEKDPREALRLFRLAAKKKDAHAQFYIGFLYMTGIVVGKDRDKAIYWYRLSAAQGHAEAQYRLGHHECREGNFQDGARFYRLASEQGHAGAQSQLGHLYELGHGLQMNIEKAISLYQSAANKGDPHAQSDLARHHLRTGEDLKEAARLNRLAIEHGNVDQAKLNLSVQYLQGMGVEVNKKEALRLIHSVTDQEDPDVKFALGVWHNTEKEYLSAGQFFMAAAEQKHKNAESWIGSYLFFRNLKKEQSRHSILHDTFTTQESAVFLKEFKLFEEKLKLFNKQELAAKDVVHLSQRSESFKNSILIMLASIEHMPKVCLAIIASYMAMDYGIADGSEPKKNEEPPNDSSCLMM